MKTNKIFEEDLVFSFIQPQNTKCSCTNLDKRKDKHF